MTDLYAIELDRPRRMRFTMSTFKRFRDRTGKDLMSGKVEDMGVDDLVSLLWAALVHDDPELTEEQVADMVTPAQIQKAVLPAMMDAIGVDREAPPEGIPGK